MTDSFDNPGAKKCFALQALGAEADFVPSMDRFARESNSGCDIDEKNSWRVRRVVAGKSDAKRESAGQ